MKSAYEIFRVLAKGYGRPMSDERWKLYQAFEVLEKLGLLDDVDV